jgi:hypothetical protein
MSVRLARHRKGLCIGGPAVGRGLFMLAPQGLTWVKQRPLFSAKVVAAG